MAEHYPPIGHLHTSTTCDFEEVLLNSLDGDEEFDIPLTISDDEEDTLLLEDDRRSQQNTSSPDHALEDIMALSEAFDEETEDGDIGYVISIPL